MIAVGMRLCCAVTAFTLVGAGTASGQYYQSGHHDHVVRDSHGHVVGRTHHDVYRPTPAYATPHSHYPQQSYPPQVQSYDPHHPHPGAMAPPVPYSVQRPVVAEFGAYSHVDELATRLESLTNQLLLDLHYNYSHNPGFQETYREAYAIFETAKFIHAAEHHQDRTAISTRLNGLDADFHHIQGDVRGWSRHHHQQVGQLGILTKMDMVEEALHHLMTDVGVQQASAVNQAPASAPAPGYGPAPTYAPAPAQAPVYAPAATSAPAYAPAASPTYAPGPPAPPSAAPTPVTSPPPPLN